MWINKLPWSEYSCVPVLFVVYCRGWCRDTQAREEHARYMIRSGIARYSQNYDRECQRLRFRITLAWHTAFRSELVSTHVEAPAEVDAGFGSSAVYSAAWIHAFWTHSLKLLLLLPLWTGNIMILRILKWNKGLVSSFTLIWIHGAAVLWKKTINSFHWQAPITEYSQRLKTHKNHWNPSWLRKLQIQLTSKLWIPSISFPLSNFHQLERLPLSCSPAFFKKQNSFLFPEVFYGKQKTPFLPAPMYQGTKKSTPKTKLSLVVDSSLLGHAIPFADIHILTSYTEIFQQTRSVTTFTIPSTSTQSMQL